MTFFLTKVCIWISKGTENSNEKCWKELSLFSLKWMSISFSVLSDSVTPWTAAHQPPLSMEFSRQDYWSESPFPSPEDLPFPGIEPESPALQVDQGSPFSLKTNQINK